MRNGVRAHDFGRLPAEVLADARVATTSGTRNAARRAGRPARRPRKVFDCHPD